MTITDALSILLPGVSWSMSGQDLTQLVIHTPGVSAPTMDQVNACIAAHSYAELRAKEYPPTANLNDALVHQSMGDGGVALAAYYAACTAVKTKYPKPS